MSAQKKAQRNVDPTDTFDENPGITQRYIPIYSQTELIDDEVSVTPPRDPVRGYNYEARHPPTPKLPRPKEPKDDTVIEPSISTRLTLHPYPVGEAGAKYALKESKSMKALKHKNRLEQFYNQVEFCDYDVLRLPSPILMDTLSKIEEESPNVSKAKVLPAKPSTITSSNLIPPTKSSMAKREIQSGIFVNQPILEDSSTDDKDEEEDKKIKKKKKRKAKKRKPKLLPIMTDPLEQGDMEKEYIKTLQEYYDKGYGDEEEEEYRGPSGPLMFSKSTHVSDNLILGRFADMMSNASSATSMQDKSEYEDLSWCEIPLTSRLVQTLRDAQCEKPKKKYRKGCLENHSFTKLKQSILTDFPHYTINGTIHQGDICFPKIARNNQGMCNPIAAFCYAHLKKPRNWSPRTIDEVLEMGTCHFMDSIAELHMHKSRKELTVHEINKMFFVGEKKIKFEISDPEVKGLIRSADKRIFNISMGLKIFFCKYAAGILRTENLNILIWKLRKSCYLLFDASPRKGNLFQDRNGTAVMTMVQRLKSIRSILLDRSNIGNSHFNICQVKLLKIMGKDEREEDAYIKERNTYIAMNERQAIVQASFDLGDLCFLFNRNKQALSMAIVSLAYSRISVPHSWHKKTLDKILIIGNQLHSLIVENENCQEVGIEHLPAVFTVGPYVLEIHIYPNRHADLMYKKSNCMFAECIKTFFEANNNCVAQIGKSFLAIWQQRDMFFSFDPYTRNKEGLKCRQGAACVSMNRDIDTMVESILMNFENREAIFHLHAVKLIRIHRDPDLTKFFPKHLTLHEVPMDTFHKHKCMKSKKRAVDKPFATADFKEHALKKLLLAGTSPGDSFYDVQSNIGSIGTHMLPVVDCPKLMRVSKPKRREPEDDDHIVDLDSPSLSDTQIVPKRPNPYDDEINIDDLASFGLTQEEKELEENPEGQEAVPVIGFGEGEVGHESETEFSHYGVMSQVTSGELDPCFRADYINTDLTYCYKLLPALELPMRTKADRDIVIDDHQQEKEMSKPRNYTPIDRNTQILQGILNAFDITLEDDPNLMIPYMCIMAAAFDIEKPVYRWDKVTIGFILKAGRMLFEQYTESFIHIDDFRFELVKNTIMASVEIIFNTYIGDGLFDTFSGLKVLEEFIDKHVFNQQDVGFVIVPHYACAVFFKKNLFYLFDPYNCDKKGNVQLKDQPGKACLMRFRSFDDLIKQLVQNLSKRVQENDTSGMNFRMLILAKPKFQYGDKKEDEIVIPTEFERIFETQNEEIIRPSNYIKLPDGSQLIRGTKHVGDYGVEVEYIAPYICVMAVAVGEKYVIRTWSSDVLDFILQAGDALYRKSKYSFVQLTKLEIPQIVVGKDEFKVQVRYVFDAPVNVKIMKSAIQKVVHREKDWVFIVTEVYTSAVCQRHGIYYLYNPFSCNELGLDDFTGFSSVARFRDLDSLCMRILFNKGKRDMPEQGVYTRFALYVCRVSRSHPTNKLNKKYAGHDLEREMAQYGGGHEEEDVEEEEFVPRNRRGFVKVTNVEVIEGSKSLARPPQDQVDLMEDHFAGLAAALMVIHKPLDEWSTKNLDKTLDLGKHIYNHADSLEQARRRTIRNILVAKYFFDVIIKRVDIEDYRHRRTFRESLNYVMRKRKFIILQTGEGTYVIYADTENKKIYLYHPYAASFKGTKTSPDEDVANACWIKFRNYKQMKKFLKQNNNMNRYTFYTFSVINVTKAPRSVIVSSMIQDWIRAKQTKGEISGKSFHEHESWMDLHDNPWARQNTVTEPCLKGASNKWYSWDIEYNNDLYLLCGTTNQHSKAYKSEYRGKQTLANLVAVIGMTGIYDLKEWNASVVDAVLISGYKYFVKCVEPISETDHEFGMADLLDECEIFPFMFKVHHQPVVEGTMFLSSNKRFNLYRALRFFFDEYYYRAGILISDKNGVKKMVAFAKRKDNEYYMFDCMTFGKPMFAPHEGLAYILRCTTLARLIHVLVLTLRGGDFFIYEVIADGYSAVQGDMNPYVEEKPILKP